MPFKIFLPHKIASKQITGQEVKLEFNLNPCRLRRISRLDRYQVTLVVSVPNRDAEQRAED